MFFSKKCKSLYKNKKSDFTFFAVTFFIFIYLSSMPFLWADSVKDAKDAYENAKEKYFQLISSSPDKIKEIELLKNNMDRASRQYSDIISGFDSAEKQDDTLSSDQTFDQTSDQAEYTDIKEQLNSLKNSSFKNLYNIKNSALQKLQNFTKAGNDVMNIKKELLKNTIKTKGLAGWLGTGPEKSYIIPVLDY
jgi:hypothetical protein